MNSKKDEGQRNRTLGDSVTEREYLSRVLKYEQISPLAEVGKGNFR